MLERLKKLFSPRPRGAEVEQERPSGDEPAAVPAVPPPSYPPTAPVQNPPADESEPKP